MIHWNVCKYMYDQNQKHKMCSAMSDLETNYCLKLDPQKVDQHVRDKWFINGTVHLRDNQLQKLEPLFRIS